MVNVGVTAAHNFDFGDGGGDAEPGGDADGFGGSSELEQAEEAVDENGMKKCYESDIVYGEYSNFMFDKLRDEYCMKNTMGKTASAETRKKNMNKKQPTARFPLNRRARYTHFLEKLPAIELISNQIVVL